MQGFLTVICWCYYGTRLVSYLFGNVARIPFCFLFALSVTLGAIAPPLALIRLTDFILLALAFLTVTTLLRRIDRIYTLTLDGGIIGR